MDIWIYRENTFVIKNRNQGVYLKLYFVDVDGELFFLLLVLRMKPHVKSTSPSPTLYKFREVKNRNGSCVCTIRPFFLK